MCAHTSILAKLYYTSKQHFAYNYADTSRMSKKPINDVLAENLAAFMAERKLKQTGLAELSGIGQTTVSLYLSPERRMPSKSGKVPSANLGEVEALARALNVEVWELLRPLTVSQRAAYKQIEGAFAYLMQSVEETEDKSNGELKRAS